MAYTYNPFIGNLDYYETAGGGSGGTDAYETVYIDAAAMIPCTTNGALQGTNEYGTSDIDIDYFAFDGGARDTVEWAIKARALSDSDIIDVALGTPQVISDVLLANNGTDLQITAATPALTIGGTPAKNDLFIFEVYRNTGGSDTMAEDSWLFGVTLQYKKSGTTVSW
jgi:hypothetical protein